MRIKNGLLKVRSIVYLPLTGVLLVAIFTRVSAQTGLSWFGLEAESGTISGQASVAGDSLASGGAYVGFTATTPPPSGLAFSEDFSTREGFYNRFDYGYSGLPNEPTHVHGDHDMNCGGPTTFRDVVLSGTAQNLDYSQLFWYCAPGSDPAKGHMMTGMDTFGYNIAWFSPKQVFTNVKKVCWDINETLVSARKWTQVVFVSADDAVRFPAGTAINGSGFSSFARGSGGFDLGFTAPDHRTGVGPSTGIDSIHEFAGFRSLNGSANWFQNDQFTSQFNGPWAADRWQTTDKAARFTHCLENVGPNTVHLTKATPTSGTVNIDMEGHIPAGNVRVVFQDDEYDGAKGEFYNTDNMTWHWDNIQITAQ